MKQYHMKMGVLRSNEGLESAWGVDTKQKQKGQCCMVVVSCVLRWWLCEEEDVVLVMAFLIHSFNDNCMLVLVIFIDKDNSMDSL